MNWSSGFISDLDHALNNARQLLLNGRNPQGHWTGNLSSSALSTATAVFALWLYENSGLVGSALDSRAPEARLANQRLEIASFVDRGKIWLIANQNTDGGWGDTVKSFSNISTTALCWAALCAISSDEDSRKAIARAEAWLIKQAGGTAPDQLIPAIIRRYGKDHTFSVPILTMCALAGRLGESRAAWKKIPQLPFELAAFPQRWFKWLKLPVVSYALPALIAIGLVRHHRSPTRNPITAIARSLAKPRALRLLKKIQPSTGGYLEATPLTSFVVMSLIGAGLADHAVVDQGIAFLVRSARTDGSWAIDTNLATWVTTLSVNGLANDPNFATNLPIADAQHILDWLSQQQYMVEHPYTLADPGCWAWTDLPGGVPDADDTPGALLAMKNLLVCTERSSVTPAAVAGVRWLINLQNSDGGIPTFCRGWGKLPFDRSSADLSAHALRAWSEWATATCSQTQSTLSRPMRRAADYLLRTQAADGSWVPLWFGNQHSVDEENPTYGTAKVLCAAKCFSGDEPPGWTSAMRRAAEWLMATQNQDGGWGGNRQTPSSIEETALAIEALSHTPDDLMIRVRDHVRRGVFWLLEKTQFGTCFEASPIGFYFAKLWYFEKLYPLIFTVAALGAAKKLFVSSAEKATS